MTYGEQNETLGQMRLLQFTHCELFIYNMEQHSSNTCIWELIQCSEACGSFLTGFFWMMLTMNLIGFLVTKLKSSLRMFYGRHHDSEYLCHMNTDMFDLL